MDAAELRQRRKALKLTQAEFAKRLGLHRDFVGQMERGEQPISERTALAITALRPDAESTGVEPKRRPKLTDPMERQVEEALIDAGIEYRTDRDGETETALDFFLPAFDVSIEVKRFYSSRTTEQMARAANVIVAQGEAAVRFLAAAIRSGDFIMLLDTGPIYQQIEALVRERPGLSEGEIARALFGRDGYQQRVNADCNWLMRERRLTRSVTRPRRYYSFDDIPSGVTIEGR